MAYIPEVGTGRIEDGGVEFVDLASPVEALLLRWHPIHSAGGLQAGGAGAGSYLLGTDDGGGNFTGSGTATGPILMFDPAAFDIPGLTTELRLKGSVHYNGVAAGVSFEFALYPITSGYGSGAMGYNTGPAIATTPPTSAPAGGYGFNYSSVVSAPVSSGPLIVGYTTSGMIAANNITRLDAVVEMRHA